MSTYTLPAKFDFVPRPKLSAFELPRKNVNESEAVFEKY